MGRIKKERDPNSGARSRLNMPIEEWEHFHYSYGYDPSKRIEFKPGNKEGRLF